MKRAIAVVLSLCAAAASSFAQKAASADEIAAVSAIEKVTVYADRAVVERRADLDLKAGTSFVVFDNLPERADPSSLQLKGRGAVTVEDLVFRSAYYAAIPDDRIKALQASRDEAESQSIAIQDRIARSNGEKQLMEKIAAKVTAVSENGTSELNPDKWSQMVKFYRDKLASLDLEIRAAQKDLKAANAELARIDQDLGRLASGRQKKKNQALAVLSTQDGAKASLSLSYTVLGPSWQPAYDLRVDSEKKLLALSYNATISQNTGEDWSGVSLSLSTARAEVGGAQPELEPWYLSTYSLQAARASAGRMAKKSEEAPAPAQMMDKDLKGDLESAVAQEAEMTTRMAAAETGATSVVFAVPGKTKIVSDALQHRVNVTALGLPAYFRYSSAPKLSTFAYLKAKMKNSSDFPLLAGPTKVFLDGAFVSDSSIQAVAPGEEFWVFLGVDEAVKVEYKLVKKLKDEQGVFDKKTRYVYQYETTVTDKKKSDVELTLWDQLPISQDKNLAVKLIEPKYAKDTDALKKSNQDIFEWLIQLKAGEAKKIAFSYSVEYPQDMAVSGLE
jgi:uncharacterized protein (TIGR02231 family)